ncbi:co-chaperone DjlA [Pseudoalteromonas denitrificans]|uniref:Co-chaperone protein DjlA n=1 Tax=Pseudoalteromonas denitrificans DSM 6059 TaxID=1123010 RepID=A0A1I1DZ34_9GAMM|nr:co-chaperone DjlA [Pseudoalteromonas denitrificans]SFB80319.1 DnaJ like chaperone protein [Pseudoalteromonas denitrificans DSM 6059]
MWGKLLGTAFGFLFGKFFGAALGFYLGHMFDKSLKQDFDKVGGFQSLFSGEDVNERQALFFYTCFSVMGHIAKSNGRVSEVHIKAASIFMDEMVLSGESRQEAQDAFTAGKEEDFPLNDTLSDFKARFSGRFDLLQLFLEIQIQMAFSDGHLSSKEKLLLQKVSKQLGISKTHFAFILKRYQAEFNFRSGQQKNNTETTSKMGRKQALEALGLTDSANDKDIKKAYRKLMSQHHPDKLVSQGLPKHLMEIANRKSQDIQAAYQYLKK